MGKSSLLQHFGSLKRTNTLAFFSFNDEEKKFNTINESRTICKTTLWTVKMFDRMDKKMSDRLAKKMSDQTVKKMSDKVVSDFRTTTATTAKMIDRIKFLVEEMIDSKIEQSD